MFLEWEMFQTKFVEEIKTHILFSVFFFRKSCRLWDNVEKYCRLEQATDDNMAHAHWIPKATNTQSACVILIALPLQKCFQWSASISRYREIAILIISVLLLYPISNCLYHKSFQLHTSDHYPSKFMTLHEWNLGFDTSTCKALVCCSDMHKQIFIA